LLFQYDSTVPPPGGWGPFMVLAISPSSFDLPPASEKVFVSFRRPPPSTLFSWASLSNLLFRDVVGTGIGGTAVRRGASCALGRG